MGEVLQSFEAFSNAFTFTLMLIVAIGLQNTYVLRQGILGRHVFAAVITCVISDWLLIFLGCMGLGSFIASNDTFRQLAITGGILFLSYYGTRSWRRAYQGHESSSATDEDPDVATLQRVVLTALGFTFLNPHVLLETVVLIGTQSGLYPDFGDRISFMLGSFSAAAFWFFLLGYGAYFLRPLFLKPAAGRILDFCIGLIMFLIAIKLGIEEFFH